MRLAVLASHPIQYHAPLFRELARHLDLTVFYCHQATPDQQGAAGFGESFHWDIDLFHGYRSILLRNVAQRPGADQFGGCDTPEIYPVLREGRFEALLVMGWNLKSFWQGVRAAKQQRIPVLVRGDSHLDTPRSPFKRLAKGLLYPPLLRCFDRILYVGQRNRAYYDHYRYPRDRLFFAPHCVDAERFAKGATPAVRHDLREALGIAPEETAALFAGKLIDLKRPLDLIEAAALARTQGLAMHVIIAGSGPLEEALRSRADVLQVPLHRLGFQNQTQIPAAYAAADVLALPSDGRETWGLVCNEAIACGTPIAVSDAVGCAPDLASEGDVGRTFPLGDVRAFSAALAAVAQVPPSKDAIRGLSDRYSLAAAAHGVIAAVNSAREGF